MTEENLNPSVERTLHLIELLLARPEGWSPQELLGELDLSRSALFDLLRTLKALGYLEQSGKRSRYVPGPRLLAWKAPQSLTHQNLLAAFYQECQQSFSPARETLALVAPGGGGYLVLAQVEGHAQVRSAFATGQHDPDLPAARHVLRDDPSPQVMATGYALERDGEALHLAVPVCRDGQHPSAVLLLSAPAFRWSEPALEAEFLPNLRAMAAHLSYRLGAPLYAPYRAQPRGSLQLTASLSLEDITAFLRGPWAASLACIRPDGRPHVIPVWQEWDGQDFFVIAWRGSQWPDYLRNNPLVSLTIDEPWMPLRRVVVQGAAEVFQAAPRELEDLLSRMTRRYLGQPAEAGLLGQVEQAFRIRPDSLRGYRGMLAANIVEARSQSTG